MFTGRYASDRLFVWLCIAVLFVRLATAWPFEQPSYMDAYYYYNLAETLYRGEGFTDYVLWNFLDGPEGLPRPAGLYWMPLSSVLIWPFFELLGPTFRAAQIPFILLSTLLALLAYRVAFDLSNDRRQALFVGLLIAFSGFYTVFWVTTDNFAPFAVFAGLAFYAAGRGIREGRLLWFVACGLSSGLAHLSRADGMLVAVAVLVSLPLAAWRGRLSRREAVIAAGVIVVCYLGTMFPWLYRNLRITGMPLAGGGIRTLFLRDYDELFAYSSLPSLDSYLSAGWTAILRSKADALWLGVQNLLAVNLMVFLAPLALWGLWPWRRKVEIWPVALYAVLLYFSMLLLFTFPGMRGGLFHSSAALLPWLFAAAAHGLEAFVRSVAGHRRQWNPATAYRFFAWGGIGLAVLLSAFLYWRAVSGGSPGSATPWNDRYRVYETVASRLKGQSGVEGDLVMVNNAPGFYYHAHRPAISIPNEGVDAVLDVARRYGVGYLVLEYDHPRPLDALYAGEETYGAVELVEELDDPSGVPVRIYRLRAGP